MLNLRSPKKRPSPVRSRSEDADDESNFPKITFETTQSNFPSKEKAIVPEYLEKPARKILKSSSIDSLNANFEYQCDIFPELVSNKKRDTIQLRRSPNKANRVYVNMDSEPATPSPRHPDFLRDSLLPRGSLTLVSHTMVMGPVGQIEAALFRNKYRVAIKKHDNRSEEKIQKELSLLKFLGNYPTILSCYGCVSEGPSMQIVYELAPYGSLDNILRANRVQSFPLSLIIAWLSDLADAIQFLQSKGVVHGDIRTENILVFERMDTKLCNFSTAEAIVPTNNNNSAVFGQSRQQNQPSFATDMTGFFHTAMHIFTSKTFEDVEKLFLGTTKLFREKKLQEYLLQRPFAESTTFHKLYNVLVQSIDYSQHQNMKEISVQLFALLEEYFDGDPREPLNEYYKKLQRFELLIKSHVTNLVPLPPRSRLRQKLFGSSTFIRNQQNYPLEALAEINSDKVMDPRTKLAEWFLEEFSCSFVEAEELSTYFMRNGIGSKDDLLRYLDPHYHTHQLSLDISNFSAAGSAGATCAAQIHSLLQPNQIITKDLSRRLLTHFSRKQ